eukprot:s2664_g14.t1
MTSASSSHRASKAKKDEGRGRSRTRTLSKDRPRAKNKALEKELVAAVASTVAKRRQESKPRPSALRKPSQKDEAAKAEEKKGKTKAKKGSKKEKDEKSKEKESQDKKGSEKDTVEKSNKVEKNKVENKDKAEKSDQVERSKAKGPEDKKGPEKVEKSTATGSQNKKVEKEKAEKKPVEKKSDGKKESQKSEKRKASRETVEKKDSKKSKKEKDVIKFKEANKPEIEHIFRTPERKTHGTSSPPPPPLEVKLTAKERAEQRLQELASHLQGSDLDDLESSCPATDLENLMNGIPKEDDKVTSSGEEDEDDEEESEEEQDDEEVDGPGEDEGEDEEDDEGPGDEGDDQSSEEESDESEEGSEKSEETGDDEEEDEEEEACDKGGEGEREKQEEKEQTPKPDEHALVPVVNESQKQVAALKNSVSHKREWDTFNRQAKTRMPAALNTMYSTAKQELFNLWMDASMDWSSTALEVQRIQEQKNVSTRGWVARQGKELRQKYDSDKFDHLVAKRKEQGLYYEDPDFPNDLDEPCMIYETWFYVREGAKFERQDITAENIKLKASMNCDAEMRNALTDAETGLMRAGALPHIDTATAAGNKALLESIDKATAKESPGNPTNKNHYGQQVAAPKKTPKPKQGEDQSKEVEPQTWTQKAAATLPVLLKEAADARTASIKLHGMEYAKELSGQLLDHAKKLETLYQDMSKALTNQADDKKLKDLMKRSNDLDLFGRKAQAPYWVEFSPLGFTVAD